MNRIGGAELCDLLVAPCRVCGANRRSAIDPDPDRERLRRVARGLSASIARLGETDELVVVIGDLGDGFARTRKVLIVWLDTIEEIVQVAEARYGHEAGRGAYKAAQVKAILARTVSESDSPIKTVVVALGPGMLDLILDALMSMVVALLNQRSDLWVTDTLGLTPTRPSLRRRIFFTLTRWLGAIYRWFESRPTVDPLLEDEIKAILTERADPLSVVEDLVVAGQWIAAHPTTVRAIMEIVATACDEAEAFLEMPGREKQAYARNLILIVLEELGFELRGAVLILAEAIIDVLIDFVVSVNNRRGVFSHRTA